VIDLRRVFKDYRQSGALQTLVSAQSAVGNGVFVAKTGALIKVLRFCGKDAECLDAPQLDYEHQRFESALRTFDERFRIYQYLHKTENAALPAEDQAHPVVREAIQNRIAYLTRHSHPLYSVATYLVVVYEGWRPDTSWLHPLRGVLTRWGGTVVLSNKRALERLDHELDAASELLTHKVASFIEQCRDFAEFEVLDEQQAYRFFRCLLNYTPFKQTTFA
jgi:type IV secretory pathway VirB4 component